MKLLNLQNYRNLIYDFKSGNHLERTNKHAVSFSSKSRPDIFFSLPLSNRCCLKRPKLHNMACTLSHHPKWGRPKVLQKICWRRSETSDFGVRFYYVVGNFSRGVSGNIVEKMKYLNNITI